MNFNIRLKKLRKQNGLTQEELADKLFVSRTAVSKWESGAGYPSIDSLKNIADFFGVSVDTLISTDQALIFAKKDIEKSKTNFLSLLCGIIDFFMVILFFLPFFSQNIDGKYIAVSLLDLSDFSKMLKIIFISLVGLSVLNGIATTIFCNLNHTKTEKTVLTTGFILSIAETALFLISKVPYAGLFTFSAVISKTVFIIKTQMTLKVS